jgi:hypothetical protein
MALAAEKGRLFCERGAARIASIGAMQKLRTFGADWRSGGALSVCLAYLLFAQAWFVGIGFGMSAGRVDWSGFSFICGSAAAPGDAATTGGRDRPASQPDCPFCFVASQTALHHAALRGDQSQLSAAAIDFVEAPLAAISDRIFLPRRRGAVAYPRAPPRFFA